MNEVEARAILGVPADASIGDIKKAYRSISRIMHPDRAGTGQDAQRRATEAMARVNVAWETLEGLSVQGGLGQTQAGSSGDYSASAAWQFVPRAARAEECFLCGSMPATPIHVTGVSTFLIAWNTLSFEGSFCRSCGYAVTREALFRTFTNGWWGWGIISIPLHVLRALGAFRKLRRLTSPQFRMANVVTPNELPMDPGAPVHRRGKVWLASTGALIVWSVVLLQGNSQPTGANAAQDPAAAKTLALVQTGTCYGPPANGRVTVVDCTDATASYMVTTMVATAIDCPSTTLGTVQPGSQYLADATEPVACLEKKS